MPRSSADEARDEVSGPRRSRRRTLVAVGAAVVVSLGLTAAVAVPRVLHAQRVAEHTELSEQMRVAAQEQADLETTLHAAEALSHARQVEALSLAEAVTALGGAEEPILPAVQAEALRTAGTAALETIGPRSS